MIIFAARVSVPPDIRISGLSGGSYSTLYPEDQKPRVSLCLHISRGVSTCTSIKCSIFERRDSLVDLAGLIKAQTTVRFARRADCAAARIFWRWLPSGSGYSCGNSCPSKNSQWRMRFLSRFAIAVFPEDGRPVSHINALDKIFLN